MCQLLSLLSLRKIKLVVSTDGGEARWAVIVVRVGSLCE